MWNRRFAIIAPVTLAVGTLAVPAAPADPPGLPAPPADVRDVIGEPILGDLTADGVVDRVSLLTGPAGCGTRVEVGLADGGFAPPARRDYRPPPPWADGDDCPLHGVVVDLGGDGRPELVLADGPHDRLLILRDLQVADTYQDGLAQPGPTGVADFDGDGLLDLYVQGRNGFSTHLNQRTGKPVPGPMRYCSASSEVDLAHLDGDGAADAVISYHGTCLEETHSGIVVLLDDGTVVQLRSEQELELFPIAEIADVDGDGRADIRTLIEDTGRRVLFLGGGDGTFRPSPPTVIANHDIAYVHRALPTPIWLRPNDFASPEAALTITYPPAYGRILLGPNGAFGYQRTATHREPDSFGYRLTEPGGGTDLTWVTVYVNDRH
nr:VCBS repeat-containing protein [Micromonospora sp. DSM 115978]